MILYVAWVMLKKICLQGRSMNEHSKGTTPMLRKFMAIALLAISIPVAAYAGVWSLNTWARSTGGTISVNGGTAHDVTAGSQYTGFFANYTGGEQVSVTITPNPGYTVKYYINQTGSTQTETADGTLLAAATLFFTSADAAQSGGIVSLWAVFHAATLTITANTDANSTVNLTSIPNVYPGTVAPRDIVFTFTANPGYVISGVTGVPAFATTSGTLGTSTVYKVTIAKGATISSAFALVATSAASATITTPNAGPAQAVKNSATATLAGTYVGPSPAFQNWSCIAKPYGATQPFAVTAGASVTTPALTTNGTYVFQYRVSATARALTSVQVTTNGPAAVTTLSVGRVCQGCHTPNAIGDPAIYAQFSSSKHSLSTYVACNDCHQGAATGGHPGTFVTSANSCESCHSGQYGAATSSYLLSTHATNPFNNITDQPTLLSTILSVEGPTGPDLPVNGGVPSVQGCSISCHFTQTRGQDNCITCHNPHRPETGFASDTTSANTIFFAYSTLPAPGTTTTGMAGDTESLNFGYWRHDTGCVKCHHQGNGEANAPFLYDNDDFPIFPHFSTASNSNANPIYYTGVAFMNAGNACTTCHGHNTSVVTAYGQSGHADVTAAAWAEGGSQSPCVRCHTTQGFINYSSFNAVAPVSGSRSVLACNGCHTSTDTTYSPFGNLTTAANGQVGNIRKIAAYPATYSQSGSANVSFQFPDAGPSNICIPCHSGRVSGQNIQGLTSTMTNTSFKNPHYAAAAGILYKSLGYQYYTSSTRYANVGYFLHDKIGINHQADESGGDTGIVGPCATCHYLGGVGHTLHIFTKDTSGNVTANNSTACNGCHVASAGHAMDATTANTNIQGFQAALGALQSLLQSKGAYYSPTVYGYFFTDMTYTTAITDWSLGGATDAATCKNNMGAAFNYHLLYKEPGAYAHNRVYAKRLIFDAIDWLQNGAMTGAINVGNITNNTGFDATAAASYLGATRP
jgi:hypothetical protein